MLLQAGSAGIPRPRARIPPSRISRPHTRDGHRSRRDRARKIRDPPGVGGLLSPSGPRARSWRHGSACIGPASYSRPRTAFGRRGAARRGRPPWPARGAPAPGTPRTADAAPGRQPGLGASGDRSLCAPRSAVADPVPPSPQHCCASQADDARAASRAMAIPHNKTGRSTRLISSSRRRRPIYPFRTTPEANGLVPPSAPICSEVCRSDGFVRLLRSGGSQS